MHLDSFIMKHPQISFNWQKSLFGWIILDFDIHWIINDFGKTPIRLHFIKAIIAIE